MQFDKIATGPILGTGTAVPANYDGVNWHNFLVQSNAGLGALTGLVPHSKPNAAYFNFASQALEGFSSVTAPAGKFMDMKSVYAQCALIAVGKLVPQDCTIIASGLDENNVRRSVTFVYDSSAKGMTLFKFPKQFEKVSQITFSASGSTTAGATTAYFDNFVYSV